MNFLCDGTPKILKHRDGRIWMISTTGTPNETPQDVPEIENTSFDWVEIGSVDSTNDLYNNGFINVNIEQR
jgi:hypothetical protein